MGTRKKKVMPSRKQAGSGEEVGSSAWQKQAWGRREEYLQSGNVRNTRESMLTLCQRRKAKRIERLEIRVHTQKSGQASQCDICKPLHPAGPPCGHVSLASPFLFWALPIPLSSLVLVAQPQSKSLLSRKASLEERSFLLPTSLHCVRLVLDRTLMTDRRRESTQVHLCEPMSTLERLITVQVRSCSQEYQQLRGSATLKHSPQRGKPFMKSTVLELSV